MIPHNDFSFNSKNGKYAQYYYSVEVEAHLPFSIYIIK